MPSDPQSQPLSLSEILAIAQFGYERTTLEFDPENNTLARFIIDELTDTFDGTATPFAQLEEAGRILSRARDDLYSVIRAFCRAEGDLPTRPITPETLRAQRR